MLEIPQDQIYFFQVLQSTPIWTQFEQGERPFQQAVILGDSAYPCRNWLIPPFAGDPPGDQGPII